MRFWPSGWVCQAVRAPGSNVTLAPCTRAGSGASNKGAKRTSPVKYSIGPLPEVCEPFRLMFMCCIPPPGIVESVFVRHGVLRTALNYRSLGRNYFLPLLPAFFEHLTIIIDLGPHACLA